MVHRKKFQKKLNLHIDDKTFVFNKNKKNKQTVTALKDTPQYSQNSTSGSTRSTPRNKKEHRKQRYEGFSFNVTNFNILFDSCHINQNAVPYEEKTPKFNGSTQTIHFGANVVSPLKYPKEVSKQNQQNKIEVKVIFQKIKKLSWSSMKCSLKIVDFCYYIGLVMKKRFQSLFTSRCSEELPSLGSEMSLCKCHIYQQEL